MSRSRYDRIGPYRLIWLSDTDSPLYEEIGIGLGCVKVKAHPSQPLSLFPAGILLDRAHDPIRKSWIPLDNTAPEPEGIAPDPSLRLVQRAWYPHCIETTFARRDDRIAQETIIAGKAVRQRISSEGGGLSDFRLSGQSDGPCKLYWDDGELHVIETGVRARPLEYRVRFSHAPNRVIVDGAIITAGNDVYAHEGRARWFFEWDTVGDPLEIEFALLVDTAGSHPVPDGSFFELKESQRRSWSDFYDDWAPDVQTPDERINELCDFFPFLARFNGMHLGGILPHNITMPKQNFYGFWMWDCCFGAMGAQWCAPPDDAWGNLLNVENVQYPPGTRGAGTVTNMAQPYGVNVFESDEPMAKRRMVMPFAIPEEHGDGTHPPVFAQALAALWSRTGDERLMRRLLPNALAYHDWFERRRQSRQLPGLLRVARWSDSGMDNSKRWGPHGSAIRGTGLPEAGWSLPMATVDVNVLSVLEKQCLAGMLEHIGRTDEALELRTHARERTRLIHQHLWDEEHGFYFDREEEAGRFIRVFTPVGLYPLLLDELPHTRFERLARHLLDESKFFTEAPMPSLAADDPDFRAERSYWMGCTWSNYNVFVLRGLLSRKPEYAFRLFDRILDTMIRPEGPMVFENYNPLTGQYYDCPNFTWQMMYFDVILRDMLGVRMEAGVPRARPARVPDAWQYYRVDNLKADGMTWTVHWDAAEGRGHAPALEIRDE